MRLSRALLALLAFGAAPFARGAVIREVELYPAATRAWTAALGDTLARPPTAQPLSPSLSALAGPGLEAAYAPVAAHLQASLALTPETFAAMPPAEQRAALELAVDDARTDLRKTAYVLDVRSRALSAPERELDKDRRAELFGVVSRLHEMRTRYAPLLGAHEREMVEVSYARAMTRAISVRNALLGRAKDMGAALSGAGRDEPAVVVVHAAFMPQTLPGVSARAIKLYERMSATPSGWGLDDVDNLLTGYGFVSRDGKHRNYSHPLFPQLRDSFSHQKTLKDVYAKAAVRLVSELARLSSPAPPAAATPAPAGSVSLEDLAILIAERKPAAPSERTVAPKEPASAPAPAVVPAPPAPAPAPADAVLETPARSLPRLAPPTPPAAAAPQAEPPAPAARSASKPWWRKAAEWIFSRR